MSQSRVLKKVIEDVGTDAPIRVPNANFFILSAILRFIESRNDWPLRAFLVDPDAVLSDVPNMLDACAEQSEQEFMKSTCDEAMKRIWEDMKSTCDEAIKRTWEEDMKSTWGVKENDPKFINEVCTANLKTIKDLHEAAKYLDMPNLMYLTEAFLKDGVRPFMDVLLPWENFSNVREHRKPAVKVF